MTATKTMLVKADFDVGRIQRKLWAVALDRLDQQVIQPLVLFNRRESRVSVRPDPRIPDDPGTSAPDAMRAWRNQRCSTLVQMPSRRESSTTGKGPAIISDTSRARSSGACSRRRSLASTTSMRSGRIRPTSAGVAATDAATDAASTSGMSQVTAASRLVMGALWTHSHTPLKAGLAGRLQSRLLLMLTSIMGLTRLPTERVQVP